MLPCSHGELRITGDEDIEADCVGVFDLQNSIIEFY